MNLMRALFVTVFFSPCITSSFAFAQSADDPILNWQTPPECGTVQDVQDRLKGILGDTVSFDPVIQFKGSIKSIEEKWSATFEVIANDTTYVRSVTVNTCEAALEVSALLIALQLDPTAVLASEDPVVQSSIESFNAATVSQDPTSQSSEETQPLGACRKNSIAAKNHQVP